MKCFTCGKSLPKNESWREHRATPPLTMDGQDPKHGYEGNNLVCSQRCGYVLGRALVAADPNILSLLPEGWNAPKQLVRG